MILKDYRLDPPACPVCGSTLYTEIFENDTGIVGCDECISRISAEDWLEKLSENCDD